MPSQTGKSPLFALGQAYAASLAKARSSSKPPSAPAAKTPAAPAAPVSRPPAAPAASRPSTSSSSSSSSSSNSDGRSTQELKAAVAAKLAAGTPLAEVKTSFAGQKLGGSVVQELAQNRGFITPAAPASRPSTSSSSSSSSSSNSDGRSTQELKAAVIAQFTVGKPLAEVKASFAGQKLGGSVVQDLWQKRQTSITTSSGTTVSGTTVSGETPSGTTVPGTTVPGTTVPGTTVPGTTVPGTTVPGTTVSGGITNPELQAGLTGAELQNQVLIERIRDAGATERTKYIEDMRIPVVRAETEGRLDLQKVVNAGYKNIANIERGADMVRSITSMFNF